MTIINPNEVNDVYGNVLNLCNPIFKDIMTRLISSGLYTSAVAPGSPARNGFPDPENPLKKVGSIQICKNATGAENMSVPLEALVDCISRAVVAGYIKGFEQKGLPSDGATNIGFSLSPFDPPAFTNISLGAAENVHEAIISLGVELNGVKAFLQQPALPFTKNPSVTIPDNK